MRARNSSGPPVNGTDWIAFTEARTNWTECKEFVRGSSQSKLWARYRALNITGVFEWSPDIGHHLAKFDNSLLSSPVRRPKGSG